MRVGETVPVNIGSYTVAQATIKEIGEGTATLIVPATLVVMGIKSELSDLPTTEPAKETIIDGVSSGDGVTDPVGVVEPNEPPAPPAEPPVDPTPVKPEGEQVEPVPENSATPSE